MKLMIAAVVIALSGSVCALAQTASPNVSQPTPIPPMSSAAAAPNLTPVLAQIDTTMQSVMLDLGKLRIEKWKANAREKQQAQSNAESVERNIREALPAVIAQVRADPQSVPASFKLYRNLNALYDVFSTLTDAAAAYGPKEEFQALTADANNLEAVRRKLGDDVESLATYTQTQLKNLQAVQQQATAAAPPKKTVVDDDETPKKKTVKKKKPATTTQPTTTSQGTTQQSSPAQTQ
jgi:hypothetical protein